MFNKRIKIGKKIVGENQPCFIIAEAGVNHNGSVSKAKKLIDIAAAAGADAVKFQTFKSEKLIIKSAPKAKYQKRTSGADETFYEMIKKLELDEKAHKELFKHAKKKKILFLSTPFDEGSADLLFKLGVKAFKVDSGNLNNPFLVKHIAKKKLPMIISTGMSTMQEIEEAIEVCKKAGNNNIILLHCTSNYPPQLKDVNLNAMETMKLAFNIPIGYSDHTPGIPVTLAAVAKGAIAIEKHFTLDKKAKGPDHLASVEPDELKELVKGIRVIEKSLGSSEKKPVPAEKETIISLRRSVVSTTEIPKGTIIKKNMIAIKRPGSGLPPKYFDFVVGRTARKNIKKDEVLTFEKI